MSYISIIFRLAPAKLCSAAVLHASLDCCRMHYQWMNERSMERWCPLIHTDEFYWYIWFYILSFIHTVYHFTTARKLWHLVWHWDLVCIKVKLSLNDFELGTWHHNLKEIRLKMKFLKIWLNLMLSVMIKHMMDKIWMR